MKFCPQCNAHYENDMFFCLQDGTPLKNTESVKPFASEPPSETFSPAPPVKETETQPNISRNTVGDPEKTLKLSVDNTVPQLPSEETTRPHWQLSPTVAFFYKAADKISEMPLMFQLQFQERSSQNMIVGVVGAVFIVFGAIICCALGF